jgi:hypothetical protein
MLQQCRLLNFYVMKRPAVGLGKGVPLVDAAYEGLGQDRSLCESNQSASGARQQQARESPVNQNRL